MRPEEQIVRLQLELPPAPKVMGAYRPLVIHGGLAFVSGHGPLLPNGTLMTGRVGESVDADVAYQAARQTGLAMVATLRAQLGSLDRVVEVIKLLGMVNCVPSFTGHPTVINGCSELFRDVFGDPTGVGARSAVGVTSLPAGMIVEVEGIFAIDSI